MSHNLPGQPASLWIRLLALCYDALLVLALLFLASGLAMALLALLLDPLWLEAHLDSLRSHPLFRAYLLGLWFLFYAGFWRHGGQTLGMRAWRLQLVSLEGPRIGWGQAGVRFATALLTLGLCNLWLLFDRKNQAALQDRLSRTRLRRLPKTPLSQ